MLFANRMDIVLRLTQINEPKFIFFKQIIVKICFQKTVLISIRLVKKVFEKFRLQSVTRSLSNDFFRKIQIDKNTSIVSSVITQLIILAPQARIMQF